MNTQQFLYLWNMSSYDLTNFKRIYSSYVFTDYDMASLNKTKFTRKYTLAQGGPYCDCHYEHNSK